MWSRKKVTIIIADHIILPEPLIALIESLSYQDIKTPCLWHQLNSQFKIKPQHFNARTFASIETHLNAKRVMRADPVSVQAGLNGAIVMDNKPNDLSLDQALEVGKAIKPDLNDFNLQLEITSAHRWYVFGDTISDFSALPTFCAQEQMLMDYRQIQDLNHLVNQLQITLYNLDINQQRAKAGQPEINSLWFWGVCDYSAKTVQSKNHQILFSDDEEIDLYARNFNITLKSLSDITPDLNNALIVINDDPDEDIWQTISRLESKNLSFNYRGIQYQ